MGKYFGTDGIRGVASEELSVQIAIKVGQYLGYHFKGKNILIGSDTRVSKDMIESALCAGITSSGSYAYTLGVTTTPSVSYLCATDDFACAIMISASHNPYYDNGIKVFNEDGEKINADLESKIEKFIDSEISITQANKEEIGQVFDASHKLSKYLDHIKKTIDADLSTFKVALDTANGSASYLAKTLFEDLNIETLIINNQPDGYNINRDCGSTHLSSLSDFVKANDVDMGFAFDGDADRVLCVDKDGNIVDGDLYLYIMSNFLKNQNRLTNNTLVTTIMSNIGLYKALDKCEINYEKTAVGDKYVYENMALNNHIIGGEQSGHIIFKEYGSTGDGLLSALKLLEALANEPNKTLQDWTNEVKIYPQLLVNVRVSSSKEILESPILEKIVNDVEDKLAGDGRVLIRASGTEPLIRVMIEASSDELCTEYCNLIVDVINNLI